MRVFIVGLIVLITAAIASGCTAPINVLTSDYAAIAVTSSFGDNQTMPVKFTGKGADVSPALSWSGTPAGTKSFAVVVEDPDAPYSTFTHWVIYNIPGNSTGLHEGVQAAQTLDDGTMQGKNGFGTIGYKGPNPPAGKPHRYVFNVYALDTTLPLQPGVSKEDVFTAMNGHVLGYGKIIGTYAS